MFLRFRHMISAARGIAPAEPDRQRRATCISFLGEPELVFQGEREGDVVIETYRRDFVHRAGLEEGYVLLTNGMSGRRMDVPEHARKAGVRARAELMWYVREPTLEIVAKLRWMAQHPFSLNGFIGFGHRVPMPAPPLPECPFATCLLLTPIIHVDQRLGKALVVGAERVDILTVNLISDMEDAFIEREGVDRFLDLLDARGYPLVFDPARPSYL